MRTTRTLNIRADLHREIKLLACRQDIKLQEWIENAILFKLKSEGIFIMRMNNEERECRH